MAVIDASNSHRIRPAELPRLAPQLTRYLQRPGNPTWPELIDAACWLCNDLGVSKSLWGARRALPWAGKRHPWRWRLSRPKNYDQDKVTVGRRAISAAWSPGTLPASFTSNAPFGHCAERCEPRTEQPPPPPSPMKRDSDPTTLEATGRNRSVHSYRRPARNFQSAIIRLRRNSRHRKSRE